VIRVIGRKLPRSNAAAVPWGMKVAVSLGVGVVAALGAAAFYVLQKPGGSAVSVGLQPVQEGLRMSLGRTF